MRCGTELTSARTEGLTLGANAAPLAPRRLDLARPGQCGSPLGRRRPMRLALGPWDALGP
jgi:hypothetical protein